MDGFGDRFDIQTLYNSCAGKFPQGFLVNFNSTDTAAAAGVSRCVASRVDMDPDYVNPFADFNLDEFLSGAAAPPLPGSPDVGIRRSRAAVPLTRARHSRGPGGDPGGPPRLDRGGHPEPQRVHAGAVGRAARSVWKGLDARGRAGPFACIHNNYFISFCGLPKKEACLLRLIR